MDVGSRSGRIYYEGIGLAATNQNIIAHQFFNGPNPLSSSPFGGSVSLFGNVNLAPGTYYFFISLPRGNTLFGPQFSGGTYTFSEAPNVGLTTYIGLQTSCGFGGPYEPPVGCGTANFQNPIESDWNAPNVNGNYFAGLQSPFEIDGMPVPEPSTLALVLGGLMIALLFRAQRD